MRRRVPIFYEICRLEILHRYATSTYTVQTPRSFLHNIVMTQHNTVRVCDAWHLGHFGRHTTLHYICGDKQMNLSDTTINTGIATCMTQHSVRVCVMLVLHLGQFLLQEICRHFPGTGQRNKIPPSPTFQRKPSSYFLSECVSDYIRAQAFAFDG